MGYDNEEELTRCGKWLVMAHLEQDFLNSLRMDSNTSARRKSSLPFSPSMKIPFMKSSSAIPKTLTKLTCSLCKTKHGLELFLGGGQRTTAIQPKNERDLLALKSLQRICTWQYGKLVCVVNYRSSLGKVFYSRWVSMIRDMCMHCGQIEQYGQCCCRSPTLLDGKEIPAACEICPKVKMRVYERITKEKERGAEISWNFKTDKEGTLYVHEEATQPGKGKCINCNLSAILIDC